WAVGRWEGLVRVVKATGKVSDAQRSTALDLLAVPHDVREAATPLDLDGKSPAQALIEVAEAEIRALNIEIDGELSKRDDVERTRVILGMGEPTHEMKLVQRYLSAATRRGERAKHAMNKYGANYRPPIHPSERPQPRWRPLLDRDDDRSWRYPKPDDPVGPAPQAPEPEPTIATPPVGGAEAPDAPRDRPPQDPEQ